MECIKWLYSFVCSLCSLAENHSCVPLLTVQAVQGQTFQWLMLYIGGKAGPLSLLTLGIADLGHLYLVFGWGRIGFDWFHCWRQNVVALNPPPEQLSETKGWLLVLRGL